MAKNPLQSFTIPGLGLTFTPAPQPDPVYPTGRTLLHFSPGDRVTEYSHMSVYTVVRDMSDGKDSVRVLKDNKVHSSTHTGWYLESDTVVNTDGYRRDPKPIIPTQTPLLSYDELKCGEVAVIHKKGGFDIYIYKGHVENECMRWYGDVNMAMRILYRNNDNDEGFGFSNGAKVFRVVGTLRNQPN